jgi:oligopeptide/dipeptide ABC transporter ATP-binding protein
MEHVLAVEDLHIHFVTDDGPSEAVSGVSFALRPGGTLGLVGESGCGKSVTALALMGLLPSPPARIPRGRAMLQGADLLGMSPRLLRRLRGDRMAMIFQEPMTSLNPALTVGEQIAEGLLEHRRMAAREAHERAVELLARVRIPDPRACAADYPHRLSGGMRQRVMIAIALACAPAVLIADEPTTALDVTVQAEILDLLRELQAETGMALLLITHDLGVVGEMADEVAVMYAGRIVERCSADALFDRPEHPYTIGLLGALPQAPGAEARLTSIEGTVPAGNALPPGCRFHPRCPFVIERCRREVPPLRELAPAHGVACWRAPLDEAA